MCFRKEGLGCRLSQFLLPKGFVCRPLAPGEVRYRHPVTKKFLREVTATGTLAVAPRCNPNFDYLYRRGLSFGLPVAGLGSFFPGYILRGGSPLGEAHHETNNNLIEAIPIPMHF